jgi:hypothetical protein
LKVQDFLLPFFNTSALALNHHIPSYIDRRAMNTYAEGEELQEDRYDHDDSSENEEGVDDDYEYNKSNDDTARHTTENGELRGTATADESTSVERAPHRRKKQCVYGWLSST